MTVIFKNKQKNLKTLYICIIIYKESIILLREITINFSVLRRFIIYPSMYFIVKVKQSCDKTKQSLTFSMTTMGEGYHSIEMYMREMSCGLT